MPGIVGIFSKQDERTNFNKMIDLLKHENWYKTDKYEEGNIYISRIHFGVFNPSSQPVFNQKRDIVLFLDGKIYPGTENDAEFCLASYEKNGIEFVKNLNGTFFIVIYELKSKKLILVNDRYGFFPYYYSLQGERFAFSPEAKSILQTGLNRKINMEALGEYLSFGMFLGDKTIFEGIHLLPAGTMLIYDKNNIHLKKYWEFKYQCDYNISEKRYVEELVETFRTGINMQLEDNLRYCMELSGGLDSRCIVGAINGRNRGKVFALCFGEKSCDEIVIARKVADKCNLKFITENVSPQNIINNAKNIVYLSEGRQHIGVSYFFSIYDRIKKISDVYIGGFATDILLSGRFSRRILKGCESHPQLFDKLFNWSRLFDQHEINKLFNSNYKNNINEAVHSSYKVEWEKSYDKDLTNTVDNYFFRTRFTYSNSRLMEFSCPSSDNAFVDIALKVPPEIRFYHRLYRKFMEVLSPDLSKIAYQKTMLPLYFPTYLWKLGLSYQVGKQRATNLICKLSSGKISLPNHHGYVFFSDWIRNNENFSSFLKKTVLNKEARMNEFFDRKYIENLFYLHKTGKQDNSSKLLFLATIEFLLQIFFDQDKEVENPMFSTKPL
ncbi:MAG: asparagine synthase-related protein [bacterium]|nr:asparagine synthase-related protein [bacterium]